MSVPVFITGTGLVTAQGVGVEANWTNLLAGRVLHETGIVPLDRDPALPRVSQLAIHAARQAHDTVGRPALNHPRTALVIGTSKGPIEDWIDQLNGQRPPDITLGIGRVAVDIAHALGQAYGPRLTLAGACASGLHALIRASDLIRQGTCDHALVVAAEASTHALFQANFARLGVLANPAVGCRPFDADRHGFLLAEAAAAVWLTHQPTPGCIQIEHGLALADSTHLTGVDQTGRTLRHLLATLGVPRVDHVHAHGTGTVLNDAVELAAIEAALGQYHPTVYSHKHAIGHTQGAAGLISVVLDAEMHRRGTVLGNANTLRTLSARPEKDRIDIRREPGVYRLTRSVEIAAGFGGTVAGVRLASKPVPLE
ncbi:MAG TPA: beta-ketoacyl synthase N-terminal-like domain-containing protein [Tepidisphaeraceae bacterium]|jgi:3-oxoacyl-[acyl-carrier-protein] synthase II